MGALCNLARLSYSRGAATPSPTQVNTIRLKLLKIGAVITRNTRTIRLMLSSQYPEQDLFLKLASKLVPG